MGNNIQTTDVVCCAAEKKIKTESKFENFWKVYPRKENKKKAKDIWEKKKLDLVADEIIARVIQRKEKDPQWQDIKFIPHATTYLNGERWKDEIQEQDARNGRAAQHETYQRNYKPTKSEMFWKETLGGIEECLERERTEIADRKKD